MRLQTPRRQTAHRHGREPALLNKTAPTVTRLLAPHHRRRRLLRTGQLAICFQPAAPLHLICIHHHRHHDYTWLKSADARAAERRLQGLLMDLRHLHIQQRRQSRGQYRQVSGTRCCSGKHRPCLLGSANEGISRVSSALQRHRPAPGYADQYPVRRQARQGRRSGCHDRRLRGTAAGAEYPPSLCIQQRPDTSPRALPDRPAVRGAVPLSNETGHPCQDSTAGMPSACTWLSVASVRSSSISGSCAGRQPGLPCRKPFASETPNATTRAHRQRASQGKRSSRYQRRP